MLELVGRGPPVLFLTETPNFIDQLLMQANGSKRRKKPKPKKGKPRRAKDNKVSPLEKMVSLPVAKFQGYKNRAPRIKNTKGGTMVCHEEFLMDVPATTTFTLPSNQVFVVQPGLTASFPWLAQIAACYEQYVIHKLTYKYRNRSATLSAGSVFMSFQNDSDDDVFGTKAAMLGYAGSQDQSIYTNQEFEVKISNYMKKYFIRSEPLPSGGDNLLYDVGLFSIAATASAATTSCGDLLVRYEIEFFKPKIGSNVGAGYYANWTSVGSSDVNLHQHPLTNSIVAVTSVLPSANYFTLSAVGATDIMTLSTVGTYLVTMNWVNVTGSPASGLTLAAGYGAHFIVHLALDTVNLDPPTGYGDMLSYTFIVSVTTAGLGAANQLDFTTAGAAGTTGWQGDHWFTEINSGALAIDGPPTLGRSRVPSAPLILSDAKEVEPERRRMVIRKREVESKVRAMAPPAPEPEEPPKRSSSRR